jgi:hypothetical protein
VKKTLEEEEEDNKMELIRDYYGFGQVEILSESRSTGVMKVRGLFGEAEKVNGNKRMYGRDTLRREVEKLQEQIKERRLLGELDHPSNEVVHLSNASHLITKLDMVGNQIIGEAEILGTPSGRVLQELIKAGVKIGTSSRATGSVSPVMKENETYYQVGDNLKMITWDMVSDPSCYGAHPTLQENQQLLETRDSIVSNLDKLNAEKVLLFELERRLRNR